MHAITSSIGNIFFELCLFLGGISDLSYKSLKETFTKPFYGKLIVDQIYSLGIKSIPIVSVTAMSTGMVMALQFGFGLEKFGGKLYVPKLVSLCLVRELGPVFTGLMLAGRVGAGIASEIGSMKVTQQLDAMRALGTSPLKRIVIPRLLAILISIPLLTVLANTLGVFSGAIIGSTELSLDFTFFIQKVGQTIKLADYMAGLGKSLFFGLFVGLTGCYYGLNVKEGTKGVGLATTKSVVASSILIVTSDFILTKLFWILENL